MKDINLVLRDKRVQLAELALEIDSLEAAATALRSVVHLLEEDEDDAPQHNVASRVSISDDAAVPAPAQDTRAAGPERSRVRRWV